MPRVDNDAAADSVRLTTEHLARRLIFAQGLNKDASRQELDGTDFQRASLHETTSQQSISMSTKSPLQQTYWSDSKKWSARILSILLCVIVASVIALFFACIYLVLKELKSEKIIKEDGAEVKLLGFWSLLILSSLAGISCCSFSWTLTYFDSYDPGMFPPTPLSSSRLRRIQASPNSSPNR
ncbi:ADP-ribosylation factor-like protein 6-interacting protein 6 isoform X2 [Clupea harengus]|uniref:ADP-ribosylation factor-like protein 6-interacting protein 6 isoform X2 n=1 Tax=Clupea harengus TaxID=7950 RepID=A0A6P8GH44_CLUHA|nr:ADP-ribosylation factor-like protein 6-interacting protein 6 isoform X2 [Clupea harengus]